MGAPRRKTRAPLVGTRPASRHSVALRPFSFDVVTLDAKGRKIERRRGRALQFVERIGKRAVLVVVQIPGGTFLMGAPESEPDSRGSERPQHRVAVPPFFLGKHAVTIDQWRAVMGALPPSMRMLDRTYKASGRQPVVRVSCDEAEAFCARLSRRSGHNYRLPTEAEWEYACRAGTTAAFGFGASISREVVNHDGETIRLAAPEGKHSATKPVGSLGVANGFGLFDMHGNVWEWCQDWWHNNYEGAPVDGSPWRSNADGRTRVLRGGSWYATAKFCRAAARSFGGEFGVRSRQIGFRVAMSAKAS